ncbi:DUF3221 domain-containing protein [Rossellomorea aquimaris]|uniref:DUF3221 domain-containing protein n=1 Tax=Rossellomorea aquimaris TaxID=189382 RepID=UPI0007D074D7|nr:DUF3221 domain-containing protein [Rossellomorea aquimaris]
MKKCLTILLLCLLPLVTGCDLSTPVQDSEPNERFIGFVTQIESNEVLINDVWFSFNDGTVFSTDKDKKIHSVDIEVGQKIQVNFDGEMEESFPGKAFANEMVFLTDAQSEKEGNAVKLVVKDPRFSQVAIQSMEKNPTGMYSLRFKELTINRDVHVLVNLNDERVIVPIHTSTK